MIFINVTLNRINQVGYIKSQEGRMTLLNDQILLVTT